MKNVHDIEKYVDMFLKKHQPQKGWREHLKKHLPSSGDIPVYMELVTCAREQRGMITIIFMLTAEDICTEALCRKHKTNPPDGIQRTWGDVVPELIPHVLHEKLSLHLVKEGESSVPEGLSLEYHFPVSANHELAGSST